jgi:hypothetical protein
MTRTSKPTVEERLDIQELFARYCWALNTGDLDRFLERFTPNGWIEHFPPKRYHGRDEIKAMVEGLWYGRPHAFMGRQHHPHNFLIERGGEFISAKVYWSVTRLEQTTNTFHAFLHGHWEASCALHEGEWRFRSLQIRHWLRQEMPWVGDPKARLVKASDPYKEPGEF